MNSQKNNKSLKTYSISLDIKVSSFNDAINIYKEINKTLEKKQIPVSKAICLEKFKEKGVFT